MDFILDPALKAWIISATNTEVELALQVGWRNVPYVIANTARVQQVPVYKGQIGEDFIESILRERFDDLSVVTKSAMSGDITLWTKAGKTVVEIKNYSKNVPTTEVEKFRRDLSATGASSGLFVSLGSSIGTITADFKIILENVDGRSVPCGYIVTDSQQQILTAVNIVIQYAAAVNTIRKEIHSKDTIVGLIKDLSVGVDELAGVRCQIQKNLTEVGSKLVSSAVNVMSAEGKLRMCIQKLQGEFAETLTTTHDAINGLNSHPGYAKLSPDDKQLVTRIMVVIQNSHGGEIICGWKQTAKKCLHIITGISLLFGTLRVEIPSGYFRAESLGTLYSLLGKKFTFNDGLIIDLSDSTLEIIESIIVGKF